jgi:transcriptional regulator with XRE-family HTH domain
MEGILMGENLFGEYIRRVRNLKDLSLRELAEKADMSFSQLSKIERGDSSPTQSTIEKLSFGLNVSKYELLALAGYMSEEIIEEMMLGISDNASEMLKESISPYKFNPTIYHISLDWIMTYGDALNEDDAELLAKELEDFYTVRKESLINRRRNRESGNFGN